MQFLDTVLYHAYAGLTPLLVPRQAVPTPNTNANVPDKLENLIGDGLQLLSWGGTAAGVVGVVVTGAMMAISHKRGESSEHMSRLGIVLGGCILVAVASPLVGFFFSDAGGTQQQPANG